MKIQENKHIMEARLFKCTLMFKLIKFMLFVKWFYFHELRCLF